MTGEWSLLAMVLFFCNCWAADHDMHAGMHPMTTAMSMNEMNTMDHDMNTMDHGGHDMNTMDHGGHDMNTMDHGGHDMNTMDHGGHDMNTMDHGDHGTSVGHSAYFFFSVDSIILFKDWATSSWQSMLGSCFGVAALAAAYEGLKLFRERLKFSSVNSAEKYNLNSFDKSAGSSSPVCLHLLQVFLHMVQVALSYSLMMVFMTFNGWLCLAVIIGAGIGYLVFGWKMTHATDVLEHCN